MRPCMKWGHTFHPFLRYDKPTAIPPLRPARVRGAPRVAARYAGKAGGLVGVFDLLPAEKMKNKFCQRSPFGVDQKNFLDHVGLN